MAFHTRFASWASTVATWLTVRDTVAVDTLARLATSRMSTDPHLFRPRKSCYPQYTLSQVLSNLRAFVGRPDPLFARHGENATILLVLQRPCNVLANMVNVYLICADLPPFLPLLETTEEQRLDVASEFACTSPQSASYCIYQATGKGRTWNLLQSRSSSWLAKRK